MKKLLLISVLLSIIFIVSSCFAGRKPVKTNTVILPLSDTVTQREGSVIYGLPRTVFTVSVTMERTIEIPGPYSKFASELLGLDNVIQNEHESWSIQDITVKSHEELDPSEFYVIKSNTLFQTNVLTLKKEGLILDLNPGTFISDENKTGSEQFPGNQLRQYDLGSDEYFQSQRDTAYKRIVVDSSFIRIPYVIEKKKRIPVDQLAEKAAKRLMEMREGKHMILTGEATVYPQNEAAINEINKIEKDYTELFTGKIWKENRTFSYQLIPEKEMVGTPVTLFKFSEATGPVPDMKKSGIAVTAELTPEKKTKDLTIITKNQIEPQTHVFDRLFYRVPDVVNLKISMGAETLFNSRKLVYQFGEVIQLPANYVIGK
jgi:hypothetical protein